MRAWQLDRLGGELRLNDVPLPELRAGSVRVRIEASVLLSYLKEYVEGKLPFYSPPTGLSPSGLTGRVSWTRWAATCGTSSVDSAFS